MSRYSGTARFLLAGLLLACMLVGASLGVHADDRIHKYELLSQRERTFLETAFSGDEAKTLEYVRVAGTNPNSIGGEPLSLWFYRMGTVDTRRTYLRDLNVQRIVFEHFKQNPNPPNLNDNGLESFCGYVTIPRNNSIEVQGSAEQKKALVAAQEQARKPHVDAMAAGFTSLIRYGLRDKGIINRIFEGCAFNNALFGSASYFDAVLSPMVKAGADINMEISSGERPIARAMRFFDPVFVERLIRDGAKLNYPVRENGFEKPPFNETCQPRVSRSLYKFVFDRVRARDPEPVLNMIRILATGGLSPLTKFGYTSNPNGTVICRYASFYDAVVDTGNLAFAKQVQDVANQPIAAAAKPAPLQSAGPIPIAPASANASETPAPIEAWKFIVENDRPVAMAKREKPEGNYLAGLRIECGAGGRLEYVPVALRSGAIQTLWVNGMNDVTHSIPLVRGRVTGADNAMISKELLASEANYRRQGAGNDWGIEMSIDGPDAGMQIIKMAGFSQVRSFMLANCKT